MDSSAMNDLASLLSEARARPTGQSSSYTPVLGGTKVNLLAARDPGRFEFPSKAKARAAAPQKQQHLVPAPEPADVPEPVPTPGLTAPEPAVEAGAELEPEPEPKAERVLLPPPMELKHQATFAAGPVTFSSAFDSGNLGGVRQVPVYGPRGGQPAPLEAPPAGLGVGGELEYELWTSADCHGTEFETTHHTWYNFTVGELKAGATVTLTIMNLNNQGKLYRAGFGPVWKCPTLGRLGWAPVKTKCTYGKGEYGFFSKWTFTVPQYSDPNKPKPERGAKPGSAGGLWRKAGSGPVKPWQKKAAGPNSPWAMMAICCTTTLQDSRGGHTESLSWSVHQA